MQTDNTGQILLLSTWSAIQLHVVKNIVTSSKQFVSPLLCKQSNFYVKVLLFDSHQTLYNKECLVSKHRLVTKESLCRAEKNLSSACSMFARSIANRLLLMLTTWQKKSKALVIEHFWSVLHSLRLAQDFGTVLASGCCAGSFSGMATSPSK